MSSMTEMAERHGRVLAELAELGLGLARGLQAQVLEAPAGEDAPGLALAFHRVSRSVRLSVALEARLERERRQDWRDDRARITHETERRKTQLRAAVTRAVLSETDGREAEALLDELEDRLDEDGLHDDFIAGPVEAQVARIRAGLGLALTAPANDAARDPGPSAPADTAERTDARPRPAGLSPPARGAPSGQPPPALAADGGPRGRPGAGPIHLSG
jgi:hypothetical protein